MCVVSSSLISTVDLLKLRLRLSVFLCFGNDSKPNGVVCVSASDEYALRL